MVIANLTVDVVDFSLETHFSHPIISSKAKWVAFAKMRFPTSQKSMRQPRQASGKYTGWQRRAFSFTWDSCFHCLHKQLRSVDLSEMKELDGLGGLIKGLGKMGSAHLQCKFPTWNQYQN
eukprot:EG_transcript_40143